MSPYENKKIHFVIDTLHALKYFIPLTIEANKNNIKSTYYLFGINKWHGVSNHIDILKKLAHMHNFNILDGYHIDNIKGNVFLMEGLSLDKIKNKKNKKIISLVEQDEPTVHYKRYIDGVDSVIFPNEFFAKWFNTESDKNLYLGSPKYDMKYDFNSICKKYELDNTKKCLIILPKLNDLNPNSNLLAKIYKTLKSCGYFVIGKQRVKDSHPSFKDKCDLYLQENSSYFFPWITTELISICDFIINFDSSTIEECLMLNKPLINFSVKKNKWPLIKNLRKEKFCINCSEELFSLKTIEDVLNIDKKEILSIKKEKMFNFNSSKKILDYFYG